MTEEQIFKKRFPEYCVGEECLSPFFDLFQIGFEEGEKQRIDELQKQNEELKEELHRQVLLRDEDRKKGKEWYNKMEELEEENERLKKESEENQDLATIAYMQGAGKYKAKVAEAKKIIRDLLSMAYTCELHGDDFVLCDKAEAFLKEC